LVSRGGLLNSVSNPYWGEFMSRIISKNYYSSTTTMQQARAPESA
jgi:hypothetical protein